ncbi:MAG: phosphatase domain-containing putative toxin [Thermodesulfobacteriota bacterium]
MLRAGRGVYVYCQGGVGRTGTVMGGYLVRLGLSVSMSYPPWPWNL